MAHIRLFTGGVRYADPWHQFAATSAAVAGILRGAGHVVDVVGDEPASLDGLDEIDLLVVNSGGGDPDSVIEPTGEWAAAHRRLGDWIAGGGRVLGLHTAANTFTDWPEWVGLLGGAWERGIAWHPEKGLATFHPAPGAADHPVWVGLDCVETDDERYTDLSLASGITPLVHQQTEGAWHVMGWAHGDRVVYDAMGHDAGSYESESRARLLLNEVDWLLGGVRA